MHDEHEVYGDRVFDIRDEYLNKVKQNSLPPSKLRSFLDSNVNRSNVINEIPAGSTLIPVPRGSKSFVEGQIYPSLFIAEVLQSIRRDLQVVQVLYRREKLEKSKGTNLEDRSTIEDQLNTLGHINYLINPENIILVDDIVTTGTTFFGCFMYLKKLFPNTKISCLALINATRWYDNGRNWRSVLNGKLLANNLRHSEKIVKKEMKDGNWV